MEIKTSKVKEIKGSPRRFERDNQITYFFTVEMENGDRGDIAKSNIDDLKVGAELKYMVTTNPKGYAVLKEFRERPNRSGGGYARTASQSNAALSLSLAVQLAVANIGKSNEPLKLDAALGGRITSMAEHLHIWLKENDK